MERCIDSHFNVIMVSTKVVEHYTEEDLGWHISDGGWVRWEELGRAMSGMVAPISWAGAFW